MSDCEVVVKAALLHDIGKICIRAERRLGTHSKAGSDFLDKYIQDEAYRKAIQHCVKYHHGKELQAAKLENDDLAYLVYEADNISAAIDRRDIEGDSQVNSFDSTTPLKSVFTCFGGALDDTMTKYYLRGLNPKEHFNYHTPENIKATSDKYKEIVSYLEYNFSQVPIDYLHVNSLLRILEDLTSYIPSSTKNEEVADISLFMHSKITAAIASSMFCYFQDKNNVDYKTACFINNDIFRQEEAFLVVSGDISGIQDFIYTVPSKGALKSLRGRSFYLDIFLENVVDEMLAALDLSRVNLIYIGGGHFYVLLPNTKKARAVVSDIKSKCNDWLLNHFGLSLYLALGYQACTANELMHNSGTVFSSVSKILNYEKVNRYTQDQISDLFNENSSLNKLVDNSRECCICHTSVTELGPYGDSENTWACPICQGLYKLGENILTANCVFAVVEDPPQDKSSLELFGYNRKLYLHSVSIKEIESFYKDFNVIYLYSKNEAITGNDISTRLWIADYVSRKESKILKTFEELAEESCSAAIGIKRLGVLRADVDNLGAAFTSGFISDDSAISTKYATLSRNADLSRDIALFFKLAINKICEGDLEGPDGIHYEPFSMFGIQKSKKRNIHIIYSGGDDMFLVGAWDELLEVAIDIRRAFKRYTNNKLTFSAGMAMFSHSYPISKMAEITGELESVAKKEPQKNSLALFGFDTEQRGGKYKLNCEHIYEWERFTDKVCGEKVKLLLDTFDFIGENSLKKLDGGGSLLYRLLDLVKGIALEKINLARFVYVLARMKPNNKDKEKLKTYEYFSSKMYVWTRNENDRKELLTALHLIIYYLRKKEA